MRIIVLGKANIRVTFDMPTADYEKLKLLAVDYNTSIEDFLIDLVHNGLGSYQECSLDHTPNTVTRKAIENARARKGLKIVDDKK